ncbi:MAG: 2-C-methyl-D-erythritol 4-phosphate cytidylyltransferase [Nitrospirota bacterium]
MSTRADSPEAGRPAVTVLVPAAGSGSRMGGRVKKQFLLLDGMPILAHTLKRFDDMPEVCEIIPIVPASEMEDCLEKCVDCQGLRKVRRVVPGGRERQDSVMNGLKAMEPPGGWVMVHDGVRPFVTREMILALISALDGCDGAVLAVPAKDTLKEVGPDHLVRRTLDRRLCWQIQTPQLFPYGVLADAFRRAYADGYYGTDEASLVERYGGSVRVVAGSYANIKITTPEDMVLAEALLIKEAGMDIVKAGKAACKG